MVRRVLIVMVPLLVAFVAQPALGQYKPASIYEFKTPLPLDPGRTLIGLKVQDSQPLVNNQRRGLGIFAATAAGAGGAVQLDISSGFTVDAVVGPKEMVATFEYNSQYPRQYLWTLQSWTTGQLEREPWFVRGAYGNLSFIGNSTQAGFGVRFNLPSSWIGPEYHGGDDGFPENGVLAGADRSYHMASTMGNATLPGDWTEVPEPGGLAENEGMEAKFNCMASLTSHWTTLFQIATAQCTLPAAQQGAYSNVNFALVASSGGNRARYIRIFAVYADGEELLYAFGDNPGTGPNAEENNGGADFDILYTTTHACNGERVAPPTIPPVSVPGGPYEAQATSASGAYVQLDGRGSFDREPSGEPNALIAVWEWDLNLYVDSNGDGDPKNDVDATGPTPVIPFPVGVTRISLRVQDLDDGLWDIRRESWVTVTPAPQVPPIAVANGPYVAYATSWDGACLLLDGSASYDPDNLDNPDAIVTYQWDLDLAVDSNGDGNPANDVDAEGATIIWTFPIGQTDVALRVKDANAGLWSAPDATTVTISTIEVAIDIKPGSENNCINMGANGVVPVAFLTDENFDASTIDPATVTFRGEDFSDGIVKLRGKKNPEPMASLEDVDGDGDLDLLVHVEVERLAEQDLTALCELGALTYDGFVVAGSDGIFVVPPQ